jgi:hypothetical protein
MIRTITTETLLEARLANSLLLDVGERQVQNIKMKARDILRKGMTLPLDERRSRYDAELRRG